jgi:hypothetical protein
MWLCSSSTPIIENRDLSAQLNILTIRELFTGIPSECRVCDRSAAACACPKKQYERQQPY